MIRNSYLQLSKRYFLKYFMLKGIPIHFSTAFVTLIIFSLKFVELSIMLFYYFIKI